MQRVVFTGPGSVQLVESEVPSPGPGRVLVRNLVTLVSPGTERAVLLGLPNAAGYPYGAGYMSRCRWVVSGEG